MVKVYNPIYDTVFKYLMEDDKAAKVLLGNILDKKIKVLTLKNNDYTIVSEDGVNIVRLDFCATIVDKKTKQQEVVTIELQKAFDEEEVVRFRKYLGLQYQNEANTIKIEKIHRKTKEQYTVLKPMHIYAIYILGHTLGPELEYPVIKGKYVLEDSDGNAIVLKQRYEFTDGVTHDLFIIQIPHLDPKPRKHLDKLLSIFDQRQIIDKNDPRFVNIDEFKDSSDDYKTLVTRLYKATLDEDMRGKIDHEEENERRLARYRYERAVYNDALEKIALQEKQLTEQEKQLAEKDTQLAAKDTQLAAKDTQLAEKDTQLAENLRDKIELIKFSASLGATPSQIAKRLQTSITDVEKVLKG